MRRIRGRNKRGRTAAEGSWWVEKRREKQGCDYLSTSVRRTELEQNKRLYKADGALRWEAACFPQIKSRSGGFSMEVFPGSQRAAMSREVRQ